MGQEDGRTVTDVAESLGISVDFLYRWRQGNDAHGKIAFPGKGNPMLTDQKRIIRDFEKRLKNAEIERDILKKHWSSSAGPRVVSHSLSDHQEIPLAIFGEEDVPNVRSISERILHMARAS